MEGHDSCGDNAANPAVTGNVENPVVMRYGSRERTTHRCTRDAELGVAFPQSRWRRVMNMSAGHRSGYLCFAGEAGRKLGYTGCKRQIVAVRMQENGNRLVLYSQHLSIG